MELKVSLVSNFVFSNFAFKKKVVLSISLTFLIKAGSMQDQTSVKEKTPTSPTGSSTTDIPNNELTQDQPPMSPVRSDVVQDRKKFLFPQK